MHMVPYEERYYLYWRIHVVYCNTSDELHTTNIKDVLYHIMDIVIIPAFLKYVRYRIYVGSSPG